MPFAIFILFVYDFTGHAPFELYFILFIASTSNTIVYRSYLIEPKGQKLSIGSLCSSAHHPSSGDSNWRLSALDWKFVCPPAPFICWSPNPQWWYLKWDLWEVNRPWGWSPQNGISAFIKKKKKMREMMFLSAMWGCGRKAAVYKPVRGLAPGTWPLWPSDLRLSGSESMRNKYLLFKPPGLWYFCYSSPNWLRY